MSEACPTCSVEYGSLAAMKAHHRREHRISIAGVDKPCAVCGKVFHARLLGDGKSQKVCSQDCKAELHSQQISQGLTETCATCGKVFSIKPSLKGKKQFCSRPCYFESIRTRVTLTCDQCGQEFERIPANIDPNAEHTFCSTACNGAWKSENLLGDKSPGWRGGLPTLICQHCGEAFEDPTWKGERKYCSRECWMAVHESSVACQCISCGQDFVLPAWKLKQYSGKFCSYGCWLKHKGESQPEQRFREMLEQAHIPFRQQVQLSEGSRLTADFLLDLDQPTVVELDGAYFHGFKEQKERDERKSRLCERLGYRIIRFDAADPQSQGRWIGQEL